MLLETSWLLSVTTTIGRRQTREEGGPSMLQETSWLFFGDLDKKAGTRLGLDNQDFINAREE